MMESPIEAVYKDPGRQRDEMFGQLAENLPLGTVLTSGNGRVAERRTEQVREKGRPMLSSC